MIPNLRMTVTLEVCDDQGRVIEAVKAQGYLHGSKIVMATPHATLHATADRTVTLRQSRRPRSSRPTTPTPSRRTRPC